MSEKIIPCGDHVAMKIIAQERTAGGLYIPQKSQSNQRDCELGEVIACGPGRTSEYGAEQRVPFTVGELVLISRGAGVQIETEDEAGRPVRVRMLRASEIFAKVEESRILSANSLVTQ